MPIHGLDQILIIKRFMSTCPFCEISAGKQIASLVFNDPYSVAILDIKPLFAGHTLLIPKHHIITIDQLPQNELEPFFHSVQKLSAAVTKAMDAQGSLIAINNRVSQSIPHLHVHIVPRSKGDGLRGFFWPRKKYKDIDEMNNVAGKIRAAIAAL